MRNTSPERRLDIERGPNGVDFQAEVDTLQMGDDSYTRQNEDNDCECWGMDPCTVCIIAFGIIAVLFKIGIVITIVVRHLIGVMEMNERKALEESIS